MTFKTSLGDKLQIPPVNTMTDAEAHIDWVQLSGFLDRQAAKEKRLQKETDAHAE